MTLNTCLAESTGRANMRIPENRDVMCRSSPSINTLSMKLAAHSAIGMNQMPVNNRLRR